MSRKTFMRVLGLSVLFTLAACLFFGPREYRNTNGGSMIVVIFLIAIEELAQLEEERRKK